MVGSSLLIRIFGLFILVVCGGIKINWVIFMLFG